MGGNWTKNSIRRARAAAKKRESELRRREKLLATQRAAAFSAPIVLKAPSIFSFRKANDESILFLRRIYDEAVTRRRNCIINLFDLEKVSFGAALALVAEINRAEELRPGSIVRGIMPKSPRGRAILNAVGFATAASGGQPHQADSGQFLKVRSGLAEDARNTGFLDDFLKAIFPPDILPENVRGRLKGAVTEALLNVVDHAYDPNIPRTHKTASRRWWICGVADPINGCHFVVYDLGAGIPATVPACAAPGVQEAFNALKEEERKADYQLIKVAVTHPSSRTGLQGRGRGLPEMRRLIDRVGDGMLWITSGKGHYIYARGGEQIDGGFAMNYPLHGTLVVWRLKVCKELDDVGGADG